MSDDERELMMPFVSVESAGGPHDDESFTCGFEVGILMGEMSAASALRTNSMIVAFPSARHVHTVNIPQLDLIAMRYGFTLEAEDAEEVEGWSFVKFNLAFPVEEA